MARDDDLLRAIDQTDTLRSKSSLEAWMRQNHDAFAARLSERIADWSVLVKLFADAGLTDRYGKPPKPETARKTWQRVRHKVQDARTKAPAPAPPPAAPIRPAPAADRSDIRALLATAPPPDDDEISDDEFFRPITKI